jgi:hypothetical protein
VARLGGDVSGFVPEMVAGRLRKRLQQEQGGKNQR